MANKLLCKVIVKHNRYTLNLIPAIMSGESLPLRKGERVPRRPLPEFVEVEEGLIKGLSAHGYKIWKVALDDGNQYGPHAMIILLILMATVTGAGLGLMWMFLA